MAEELKAAALGYLNQGLSIVLMTVTEDGKKSALHKWKQWETRRQAREEFDALPWLNVERFAIVCGVQGINGLYFTPIDTDNPDFDKGLLRTTQTERTPKGGHHFIYWSRVNAKGKKLRDLKIELLGQGNLCLMYPSKDYVKVNDNLPTEIDDIKEVFESLAEKSGGHTKPRPQKNRIRYCCREALTRDSHIDHLMRLAIASEYMRAGYPNEDIVQLFKSQDDYDHDKCLVQVESADPLKAARPETIREYGYCYPECQEDCIETRNRAPFQIDEKELMKALTADDLVEILGSTVKHDNENKAITFLSMLLTYTEDDQINLGFLAESSTGKSYIPLEISWYFPKEDVIKTGYCSPTAFFHDWGIQLLDPSDKRDVEEKDKGKITHIDLHQKILIFLDQPHDQLLQRLRSLLSHDEKQIIVKITDKREKSGLRTKNIIIEGYPTVLFCTARYTMQDQEKTRLLLLSPEINQEKLRETIALRIDKESDREAFQKRMTEDPQRRFLATRVWTIREEHIAYVKIPEALRNQIYQHFQDGHKFLIPRHQRDITRLLAIIKGHALLNYMHRERIENSIFIDQQDVEVGFRLYSTVSEANELGLSPELYTIYQRMKQHVEDSENGITKKDFQKLYYREFHKPIGGKTTDSILKVFESVGLLIEQPDPIDRRVMRYLPPEVVTSIPTQNYIPPDPGTAQTDHNQTSLPLEKYPFNDPNPSIPSNVDNSPSCTRVKGYIVLQNNDKPGEILGQQPKLVIETEEEAARRIGELQCQECKARGQPMFFTSDADLAAHMKAYHEGEG